MLVFEILIASFAKNVGVNTFAGWLPKSLAKLTLSPNTFPMNKLFRLHLPKIFIVLSELEFFLSDL